MRHNALVIINYVYIFAKDEIDIKVEEELRQTIKCIPEELVRDEYLIIL